MVEDRLVTVFGGTGFLGSQVVSALLPYFSRVRSVSRRADAVEAADPRVEMMVADVHDDTAVDKAVAGAQSIVNCVGLYNARNEAEFDAVHVEGARRVAAAATSHGVRRLVHISGIGANARSASAYVRARGRGEDAVREAFPSAVVLRPSMMFSESGGATETLRRLVRNAPVIPLFGDGASLVQPVYAGDVAEAVAIVASENGGFDGRAFELGGPETMSYRQLLRRLAALERRRPLLVPTPFAVWRLLAVATRNMPRPPVTDAQITLISSANVVAPGASGFSELGIEPKTLRRILTGGSTAEPSPSEA